MCLVFWIFISLTILEVKSWFSLFTIVKNRDVDNNILFMGVVLSWNYAIIIIR